MIVADAGRDRPAPAADEILALSDGRFGFKVADPYTSKRRGAFAYDEVRAAREAEERAERLRLYYVAMTRAIDRLIVSGALDPEQADETPIGWVLGAARPGRRARARRRGAGRARARRRAPPAAGRAARPGAGRRAGEPVEPEAAEPRSSRCSRRRRRRAAAARAGAAGARAAARAAALRRAQPLVQRDRALRALLVPLLRRARRGDARARGPPRRPARGDGGLLATELGDAVHRLLEQVDLAAPARARRRAGARRGTRRRPTRSSSGSRGLVDGLLRLRARRAARRRSTARRAERPFAFEHDGVLFHGFLDVLHVDGGRALVVDYKTNVLGELSPGGGRRARVPRPAARLRARVLPRRRRRGRGRLPVPRAAGRAACRRASRAPTSPGSRRSCRRRSRASGRASSCRRRASSPAPAARRSTSSCAGPRLPGRGPRPRARARRAPRSVPRSYVARGAPARRAEARADRADRRAAEARRIRTRRSRCARGPSSSCSSP